MKKYILSFLIVATFSVYAVYLKLNGINTSTYVSSVALTTTTKTSTGQSGNNPVTPFTVPASFTKPVAVTKPAVVSKPPPTPVQVVPTPTPVATTNAGQYKNGQYTGTSANAYYGNVQVQVTIAGGAITNVQLLDYPQDRGTSVRINQQALPILEQEAIQAQSANIDTVSGATDSSGAFIQSLSNALAQAANS